VPLRGETYAGPIPKPQSRAAEKKIRKQVLIRDHYRCRACGSQDHVDVHHLRFRSAGGSDSVNNCVALCRVDHAELHAYRLFILGDDANKRLRFERGK
jgi:5-methylcytosine-specific restriction endonuclease McrA